MTTPSTAEPSTTEPTTLAGCPVIPPNGPNGIYDLTSTTPCVLIETPTPDPANTLTGMWNFQLGSGCSGNFTVDFLTFNDNIGYDCYPQGGVRLGNAVSFNGQWKRRRRHQFCFGAQPAVNPATLNGQYIAFIQFKMLLPAGEEGFTAKVCATQCT